MKSKKRIHSKITATQLNALSAEFCPVLREELERQKEYDKAEKLVIRLMRIAVGNGHFAITISPWENICLFAKERVLKDFEKRGFTITNIGNSKGLSWGFPKF